MEHLWRVGPVTHDFLGHTEWPTSSGKHCTGSLSESMLSLAAIPVGHHQAKFMTCTVWSVRRKPCAVDRKCLGMLEAQRQKTKNYYLIAQGETIEEDQQTLKSPRQKSENIAQKLRNGMTDMLLAHQLSADPRR